MHLNLDLDLGLDQASSPLSRMAFEEMEDTVKRLRAMQAPDSEASPGQGSKLFTRVRDDKRFSVVRRTIETSLASQNGLVRSGGGAFTRASSWGLRGSSSPIAGHGSGKPARSKAMDAAAFFAPKETGTPMRNTPKYRVEQQLATYRSVRALRLPDFDHMSRLSPSSRPPSPALLPSSPCFQGVAPGQVTTGHVGNLS